MAYLTKSDIEKRFDESEHLEEIIRNDDTKLNEAIITAQSDVRAACVHRYDMETEFARTGTSREPMVLQIAADIAIYYLWNLTNPRLAPEKAITNYEFATQKLDKIQRGRLMPNLPEYQDEERAEEGVKIRYSSNVKNNNTY